MPNALAAANVGAMPNTGVDPGPMGAQGPQVDASAMATPPSPAAQPGAMGAQQGGAPGGAGGVPGLNKMTVSDIEDGIHKLAMIGSRLRTLTREPGPIARKRVIDVAVKIVSSKLMSAQIMAQTLSDLPEDPQDIREWVERHANDVQNHEAMMMAMIHGIRMPGHPLAAQLGSSPPGQGQGGQPPQQPQGGPPPTLQ